MKKYSVILMALCMAVCLCISVLAQPNSAGDFSYLFGESTFAETPESEITAGDLVAVTARLHSTLNNGGLSQTYDFAAYNTYAEQNGIVGSGAYSDESVSVTRAETVTALYNAVNGKIDLAEINEVLDMVDSSPADAYYEAALSFMKAGVIYGYDMYGSFKPMNAVKKYELGLMVDRLLNASERVTKEYVVYSSAEPMYLIDDFILDTGARGWYTGGSGWRNDYTGSKEKGTINNYSNFLRDYSTDDDISTTRRIHIQQDGKLVFESVYEFSSGDTLHFSFLDAYDNVIASAGWKKGSAYAGNVTASAVKVSSMKEPAKNPDSEDFNYYMEGKLRTRVVLDLDNGIYEVWMGKKKIGNKHTLDGDNLAKIKIHTGIAETSVVDLDNTHLWKNYRVNDVFRLENQGDAPVGYTVKGNVSVERILSNASNTGEVNSMKMSVSSGNTNAVKYFDKATGKVIAEAYVLLDSNETVYGGKDVTNSAYFTLTYSDIPVLTVKNEGNKWYTLGKNGTKKELTLTTKGNVFTSNVWQWIRIEADTNTQTADIKINGKYAAENVSFLVKVDGFDGLEVGVDATSNDVIYFDDIEVYETFVDYYNTDGNPDNDYVPEPVPLDTGDYILNMSVCNLWRNGSHYGWDWIRPYAELEPAIGYYDEGNPEAMDWEIKYLTEHGIKNYMTCWYPTSTAAPFKKPRMVDALHDGYFNAKYSDKMTFSLMFENSGYTSNAQKENFQSVVFPLWMDWYFSDPRYFRIKEDGKEYVFLTIYQYLYFLDMACTKYELLERNENGDLYLKKDYQPSGNTPSAAVIEASKDAVALIEWMEQEIVDAGYADGLIVVYGGSTQSPAAYKTMAQMGGDGIILYAWGRTAWNVETQKSLATTHTTDAKAQGIDLLTLATPGFNDIGWTSLRPGYMTTDNFEKILVWHKEQMQSNFGKSADSWKSKLITFDTWNEYGEGHYIFPTAGEYKDEGYGGFGYLDAIAEVFGGVERDSDAGNANNTYPSAIQKARVGSIYPNDLDHYIRRDMLEAVEIPNSYISLGGRDFTKNETANDTALEKATSNFADQLTGISSWLRDDFFMYDSTRKCWYGKTTSSCNTSNPARITFDSDSQFKNVKMDDVAYIRLRLGTSSGGSTGKIYFKNTTDTSQYNGYNETRTFRFNTYSESDCENGKYHEYLFNVKEHKEWTGTLAGIMLECTNEPNETVYIYDLEFIAEDVTTRKPTIYVDKQKYDVKDYGEIRSNPTSEKGEVYIAPTEEGGLYKLLHIVYEWNRSDYVNAITGAVSPANILKLDTPDGTTFEFNYKTHQYKKNGKLVGTDSNLVLYDGAPVIPLLYILDNAGYTYSYDFTNRIINITVANKFEIVDDIENGNAEGSNTKEFYSGNSAYSIAVVTDPKDSGNKVWDLTSAPSKVWSYIRTDFEWQAGKTYTIDFDARLTGTLGDGSKHPEASAKLVFNARYADTAGTNGVEHNPEALKSVITTDWKHFTLTYTVAETLDTTSTFVPQLSFYVDPYNDLGVNYQMDNIVVRTEPIALKLVNGNAEGTEQSFKVGNNKNTFVWGTESNGNKYWGSICNDKGTPGNTRTWNYLIHSPKISYEAGVTYYYRVKAKIGTNANGQNTSGKITLNARYADTSKVNDAGEWYAHTQELMDKLGKAITFKSGEGWQQCYGSFTVSLGYVPIAEFVKPAGITTPVEEITFFANPDASYGITFMIDDFEMTTDPTVYESWIG